MTSVLRNYPHINASPRLGFGAPSALPLTEEMTQSLKYQLLLYRIRNLPDAFRSQFSVSGLSSEANVIAGTLGRFIVDAPELQAEHLPLPTPFSDHRLAERPDDLGTLAAGAALTVCH
jgi:hypothetical protein